VELGHHACHVGCFCLIFESEAEKFSGARVKSGHSGLKHLPFGYGGTLFGGKRPTANKVVGSVPVGLLLLAVHG